MKSYLPNINRLRVQFGFPVGDFLHFKPQFYYYDTDFLTGPFSIDDEKAKHADKMIGEFNLVCVST